MKKSTITLLFAFFLVSFALGQEPNGEMPLPMNIDFELFYGVNLPEVYPGWLEGKGVGTPQIMNGAWYRADVLYGSATASVTFDYVGLKDEWIISPPFVASESTKITFMAALSRIWNDPSQGNLSYNDSISVLVSTSDFNFEHVVHTFKFSNQPTWIPQYYDFDLGQFADQLIRVAFYATNGQEANSLAAFHLDDIVIKNAVPHDALAFGLVEPSNASCFEENQPVVVRIKNDGLEPISSVPVRVRIRGALTKNLFGAYQGIIEPNDYVDFEVGTLEDTPFGEYHFSVETEHPADGFGANNVKGNIVVNNPEPRNLPLPFMNFIGFYTNNLGDIYPGWYEARGKDYPRVKMDTDWQGDNFGGSRTASVYFVQLGTEDWMIGPKFTATENLELQLRAALQFDQGTTQMGSDDKLAIMVSTDCGATWEQAAAFDRGSGLTSSLQAFSFPLSQYAGQEIILAFYATTGAINNPESYIFHITDVEIKNQFGNDAGVTALLSPGNSCSFSDTEMVTVEVTNFGTQSISNFQVAFSLNDDPPIAETISQSLAHGETLEYSFQTTIDLSEGGENHISVYTLLENDEFEGNDGLFDVPLVLSSFDLSSQGAYTMGFEPHEDFSGWLVQDANNDGTTWMLNPDPVHANTGSHSYSFMSNQTSVPSNDWLMSPCFNLQEGATYYVSFHYKNRAANWPESLKLNLGTAQQASAMSQVILDLGQISNSVYNKVETTFSVSETGEYYFGWHAYGPADQFGMHIDDITIYQVFEHDLSVTQLIVPREKDESCGLIPAQSMQIEITNFGSTAASAFDVYLQINDLGALAFSFTETIAAGQSQWFSLEGGFTLMPDQVYQLTAWSSHLQEQNPVNDTLFVADYLMQQYFTSFEATDDVSDWMVQNLGGVNEWQLVEDASVANTGSFLYAIRTDGAGGNVINNDWLFSECFYLEAGKCYEISFYYRSRFSTENLRLSIGTGQDVLLMEQLLISLPSFNTNAYQRAAQQFTVEESGVYYFGWHTDGGTSGRYYIYIDDVAVVEDLDNQPVANPDYFVLDHEVGFRANAQNATTYLWDFGDGQTSVEENPFHVYAQAGTYNVSLSVGSGCVTNTMEFTVELELPVYEVTFEVTDLNGTPVTEAVVNLEGNPGVAGMYLFELSQGGYVYEVTFEDYLATGNFTVIDSDLIVPVILPMEGETFTVTFVVKDTYGQDVADAVISLNGVENDPGDYVFESVAPGTYAWMVNQADFLQAEGEVTVVDMDVTVHVELITTSITDPFLSGIRLYPNPAGSRITISFDGIITGFRIMNMNGQVKFNQVVERNRQTFDVSLEGLQPGTYILQLITESGIHNQTFIKK